MVGAAIKPPTASTAAPAPKRPEKPLREGSSKRGGLPALAVRIALTVFIVWHFTGVFLAALCVPASSPLVLDFAQKAPMQWYLDALYMNQGHSFFAPEVGPGHLIRYQLLDQSGREVEHGEFPSRKEHWPRLLYHRYFMLADQAELPFEDKPTRDYWARKYLEAYGRRLLANNSNAQAVRLQLFAHWPPPRKFFLDANGKRLDPRPSLTDPKGYEMLIDATQRRSDLAPPPPTNQSFNSSWQQGRPETARRWSGAPR